MFDISFSELMIIALVALVVIGPEKLPKVARTAGALFGRMQRMMAQVKEEINRETRFDELQKLQADVKSQVEEVGNSILAPSPEKTKSSTRKAVAKSTTKTTRTKAIAKQVEVEKVVTPKTPRKASQKSPKAIKQVAD